MSDNEKDLIRWKTDDWKDPALVAWYAGKMAENHGTELLKKQLESKLVERFALGKEVLDVAIGNAQTTMALARRGMEVSGIVSSQAMLDELLRRSGGVPVDLQVGDFNALSQPEASVDYLVALEALACVPDWRTALNEWRRVLRPSGRMLFDIPSLDHLEAVYGAEESARRCATDASALSHVRVADLLEWADGNGMKVVAVVPVGAFLGGGAVNHWLRNTLEDKFWWKRMLSWMAAEKSFFNLALYLEEHLVARLTTRATPRFVAVLDNVPDREGNQRWLEEDAQRNVILSGDVGIPEMHRIYGPGLVEFADALAGHLRTIRNRCFFFALVQAVLAVKPNCDLAALLPANVAALFEDWQLQDELDELTSEIADTWYRAPQLSEEFQIAGTALGPGLEYRMTERILKDCFGVFSGVRS